MNKILVILFLSFHVISSVKSQTYNSRFNVSELSLGAVINSGNSGLDIASVGLSNGTFLTCLLGVNEEGIVQDSICIGYSEPFLFGFFLDAEGVSLNPDNWVCLGSHRFPEDIAGGWYLILDESLNVQRENRWLSPFYDPEVGSLSALSIRRDAILLEDGTIFVSYDGSTDQTLTKLDAGVICFDENDELVWETQWVTADNEIPFALTYHENYLFVSVMRNPSNLVVDGLN
jgi:hypothetical protein